MVSAKPQAQHEVGKHILLVPSDILAEHLCDGRFLLQAGVSTALGVPLRLLGRHAKRVMS